MTQPPRLKVMTLVDLLVASGGAERIAMEIASRLDPDRFESVLCASRYEAGQVWPSIQEAERRLTAAGVRFFGLGRQSRYDAHKWFPLWQTLRGERFDVLHSHMFGSNAWGTVVARLARVPVVVAHEHTWSFQGDPLRIAVDRHLIARGASSFVTVSRYGREKMIEVEGIPESQILFVPNGIPSGNGPTGADLRAELGIAADAPVIGTVSVLRPEKALDMMLRATAELVKRWPDLQLIIAGEGPQQHPLLELVGELGIADNVKLIGFRPDVPDVLAALDVAVSSSVYEGGPLAMMEFMEAALPIVATRVGGVPDVIEDGEHGLLVESGDPEALAVAVGRLLNDRELASRLGAQARARRREEFDIIRMVNRFEALYERLRKGYGPPPTVAELEV